MISRLLLCLVLVTSGALLTPGAATARGVAGASVTVVDFAFSPAVVSTPLGSGVTWTFEDSVAHTATSDQGFFHSGLKSSGDTWTRRFTSSGTFRYHCAPHPSMTGAVRVPLTVSGSPADGWRLRWSTAVAAADRDFDVQVRRVGASTWRWLRKDTTRASARFDPDRAGSYRVRARTSNVPEGVSSAWSPIVTLGIT